MFAEPPPLVSTVAPVSAPAPIWRGRDPLIGMAILIGTLVLIVVLLGVLVSVFDLDGAGLDFLGAVVTIGYELLFAGAVLLMARRRGLSLSALGFRRPDCWGPLGIVVVGTYASLFAYGLLVTALREAGLDTELLEGGNEIPIDSNESTLPLVALLAIFGVAVVVVAPLAEELFFRGLLFRALDGVWAGWAAIAVSGLAFGVFHLNLSVLVPFSIIGMLFAWGFKASGSLWVTVIAHFIINSLSFIVTVIGVID